jgi:capsular polysaccharide biosynthesis protein
MPILTRDRPTRIRPAPQREASVSPLRAAIMHPIIAIAPIVLLVIAALAVGQARPATYTAQARVAIGSFSPTQEAAPGAAYAGTQFASAYSRAITAHDVVAPAAKEAGLRPDQVARRLTATPIPDSPLLQISATGPSQDAAVKLTNAATDALLSYVRRSDITGAQAKDLLDQYHSAQADADRADSQVALRQRAANRQPNSQDARHALSASRTRADTLDLRARALRASYLDQAQSESSGIPVRTLNAAGSASSDRSKTIKLVLTIAVLAGLVVGVALATAVETARAGRRGAPA